jgi:ribosome maturation factor RimP
VNVGEFPHIFLFVSNVKSELEVLVAAQLDALQYDLVDLRRGGSRSRPIVEIRIDRRDGEKVTVEDCARVSRSLEGMIDADAARVGLGEHYELQVSSPGADRPLKTARDWRRFVGRRAAVKSTALAGRREVEILGVEGDEPGAVVIVGDGDEQYRLPLGEIAEARLVFHWNR